MKPKRENTNRGYLRLDVWNDAMELHRIVTSILGKAGLGDPSGYPSQQILEVTISVPSNIAEGYCRRSAGEYLYFLNVALGSLGELLTRMTGLRENALIDEDAFEWFDGFHFKLENDLLALIKTLEVKRRDDAWEDDLREPREPYIH